MLQPNHPHTQASLVAARKRMEAGLQSTKRVPLPRKIALQFGKDMLTAEVFKANECCQGWCCNEQGA